MIESADFISVEAEILQLVSTQQAWHYRIVPRAVNGTSITFITAENNIAKIPVEELEMLFDKTINLETFPLSIVNNTLAKYYRKNHLNGNQSKKLKVDDISEDFVEQLIKEAKSVGSSDIHIEPYEKRHRIRMRIDGQLIERYILDEADYPALINKIKIRSHLDIAEKRLPQDGRISIISRQEQFDIRVSILPTLYGEKIVMRLLRNDVSEVDISAVGMNEEQLESYLEGVKKPHGIILVSGPTGSGKTTTLYATLKLLNKSTNNILTVEDPIEYTLEGINQVQVKENIGLTFAKSLKTFLRQDPDIIMVGEIRDAETASIAIRSALTGHLVLSTIHTNSAWGTVSRLTDMGVPPFLLANTLNTTLAQRLVRLLCPDCKKEEKMDESLYPSSFKPDYVIDNHYTPVGCEHCYFTGYKGRKALFEVIPITKQFSNKIKNNVLDVDDLLESNKIKRLSKEAFEIFAKGDTSLEEVYPLIIN